MGGGKRGRAAEDWVSTLGGRKAGIHRRDHGQPGLGGVLPTSRLKATPSLAGCLWAVAAAWV